MFTLCVMFVHIGHLYTEMFVIVMLLKAIVSLIKPVTFRQKKDKYPKRTLSHLK